MKQWHSYLFNNKKSFMESLTYSNVARVKEIFESEIQKPNYRKLRGYAFDPSLSNQLETSAINYITFKIAWEEITEGPCGEYVEVIDIDPASGLFYEPVFLNDPHILATDG
jgi:hypothetical protein